MGERQKTSPQKELVPNSSFSDHVETPVMQGSPKDLAALALKLVDIMQACGKVRKQGFNDAMRYNYFKAEDILAAVNVACSASKVAVIPRFSKIDDKEKTMRSGQMAHIVTVSVDILLMDSDTGATISIRALGEGSDPGDKAVAKAQTMAIKYALMSMCLISTGDDPEADIRTDREFQPAKTAPCRKCGEGTGYFVKESDYEGEPIDIFKCSSCNSEFRERR